MILPVQNYKINKTAFTSGVNIGDINSEELKKHPILLNNNLSNRMQINWDKFTNALTMYPARGLKGSKNSNFYEFLTMGIIPYLTGSLTLMAVFNSANKWFMLPRDRAGASRFGNKMAFGVLFYGIAKSLSAGLVTRPVKWLTGVDTEEPYAVTVYKLPEHINDSDITNVEYHKVLESLEFPRWDVKYGNESEGESRNYWFDKIAKRIGLGTNLNDSDQDVKPRVKEIAVKTNLAKTFSSYLWAGVGVGLAMQNTWTEFFEMATFKPWKGTQFLKTIGKFIDCTFNSAIELYRGQPEAKSFWKRANGKLLIGAAALSTFVGISNVLISRNKPSKLDAADIIEENRKYVIN